MEKKQEKGVSAGSADGSLNKRTSSTIPAPHGIDNQTSTGGGSATIDNSSHSSSSRSAGHGKSSTSSSQRKSSKSSNSSSTSNHRSSSSSSHKRSSSNSSSSAHSTTHKNSVSAAEACEVRPVKIESQARNDACTPGKERNSSSQIGSSSKAKSGAEGRASSNCSKAEVGENNKEGKEKHKAKKAGKSSSSGSRGSAVHTKDSTSTGDHSKTDLKKNVINKESKKAASGSTSGRKIKEELRESKDSSKGLKESCHQNKHTHASRAAVSSKPLSSSERSSRSHSSERSSRSRNSSRSKKTTTCSTRTKDGEPKECPRPCTGTTRKPERGEKYGATSCERGSSPPLRRLSLPLPPLPKAAAVAAAALQQQCTKKKGKSTPEQRTVSTLPVVCLPGNCTVPPSGVSKDLALLASDSRGIPISTKSEVQRNKESHAHHHALEEEAPGRRGAAQSTATLEESSQTDGGKGRVLLHGHSQETQTESEKVSTQAEAETHAADTGAVTQGLEAGMMQRLDKSKATTEEAVRRKCEEWGVKILAVSQNPTVAEAQKASVVQHINTTGTPTSLSTKGTATPALFQIAELRDDTVQEKASASSTPAKTPAAVAAKIASNHEVAAAGQATSKLKDSSSLRIIARAPHSSSPQVEKGEMLTGKTLAEKAVEKLEGSIEVVMPPSAETKIAPSTKTGETAAKTVKSGGKRSGSTSAGKALRGKVASKYLASLEMRQATHGEAAPAERTTSKEAAFRETELKDASAADSDSAAADVETATMTSVALPTSKKNIAVSMRVSVHDCSRETSASETKKGTLSITAEPAFQEATKNLHRIPIAAATHDEDSDAEERLDYIAVDREAVVAVASVADAAQAEGTAEAHEAETDVADSHTKERKKNEAAIGRMEDDTTEARETRAVEYTKTIRETETHAGEEESEEIAASAHGAGAHAISKAVERELAHTIVIVKQTAALTATNAAEESASDGEDEAGSPGSMSGEPEAAKSGYATAEDGNDEKNSKNSAVEETSGSEEDEPSLSSEEEADAIDEEEETDRAGAESVVAGQGAAAVEVEVEPAGEQNADTSMEWAAEGGSNSSLSTNGVRSSVAIVDESASTAEESLSLEIEPPASLKLSAFAAATLSSAATTPRPAATAVAAPVVQKQSREEEEPGEQKLDGREYEAKGASLQPQQNCEEAYNVAVSEEKERRQEWLGKEEECIFKQEGTTNILSGKNEEASGLFKAEKVVGVALLQLQETESRPSAVNPAASGAVEIVSETHVDIDSEQLSTKDKLVGAAPTEAVKAPPPPVHISGIDSSNVCELDMRASNGDSEERTKHEQLQLQVKTTDWRATEPPDLAAAGFSLWQQLLHCRLENVNFPQLLALGRAACSRVEFVSVAARCLGQLERSTDISELQSKQQRLMELLQLVRRKVQSGGPAGHAAGAEASNSYGRGRKQRKQQQLLMLQRQTEQELQQVSQLLRLLELEDERRQQQRDGWSGTGGTICMSERLPKRQQQSRSVASEYGAESKVTKAAGAALIERQQELGIRHPGAVAQMSRTLPLCWYVHDVVGMVCRRRPGGSFPDRWNEFREWQDELVLASVYEEWTKMLQGRVNQLMTVEASGKFASGGDEGQVRSSSTAGENATNKASTEKALALAAGDETPALNVGEDEKASLHVSQQVEAEQRRQHEVEKMSAGEHETVGTLPQKQVGEAKKGTIAAVSGKEESLGLVKELNSEKAAAERAENRSVEHLLRITAAREVQRKIVSCNETMVKCLVLLPCKTFLSQKIFNALSECELVPFGPTKLQQRVETLRQRRHWTALQAQNEKQQQERLQALKDGDTKNEGDITAISQAQTLAKQDAGSNGLKEGAAAAKCSSGGQLSEKESQSQPEVVVSRALASVASNEQTEKARLNETAAVREALAANEQSTLGDAASDDTAEQPLSKRRRTEKEPVEEKEPLLKGTSNEGKTHTLTADATHRDGVATVFSSVQPTKRELSSKVISNEVDQICKVELSNEINLTSIGSSSEVPVRKAWPSLQFNTRVVAVVNLCMTERYYSLPDLRRQGIEAYWLKVDGSGDIPSERQICLFFRLMAFITHKHASRKSKSKLPLHCISLLIGNTATVDLDASSTADGLSTNAEFLRPLVADDAAAENKHAEQPQLLQIKESQACGVSKEPASTGTSARAGAGSAAEGSVQTALAATEGDVNQQQQEDEEDNCEKFTVVVHCTHGVNRTGLFLAMLMMQLTGCSAALALKMFENARGNAISKDVFRQWLREQEKREECSVFKEALQPPVLRGKILAFHQQRQQCPMTEQKQPKDEGAEKEAVKPTEQLVKQQKQEPAELQQEQHQNAEVTATTLHNEDGGATEAKKELGQASSLQGGEKECEKPVTGGKTKTLRKKEKAPKQKAAHKGEPKREEEVSKEQRQQQQDGKRLRAHTLESLDLEQPNEGQEGGVSESAENKPDDAAAMEKRLAEDGVRHLEESQRNEQGKENSLTVDTPVNLVNAIEAERTRELASVAWLTACLQLLERKKTERVSEVRTAAAKAHSEHLRKSKQQSGAAVAGLDNNEQAPGTADTNLQTAQKAKSPPAQSSEKQTVTSAIVDTDDAAHGSEKSTAVAAVETVPASETGATSLQIQKSENNQLRPEGELDEVLDARSGNASAVKENSPGKTFATAAEGASAAECGENTPEVDKEASKTVHSAKDVKQIFSYPEDKLPDGKQGSSSTANLGPGKSKPTNEAGKRLKAQLRLVERAYAAEKEVLEQMRCTVAAAAAEIPELPPRLPADGVVLLGPIQNALLAPEELVLQLLASNAQLKIESVDILTGHPDGAAAAARRGAAAAAASAAAFAHDEAQKAKKDRSDTARRKEDEDAVLAEERRKLRQKLVDAAAAAAAEQSLVLQYPRPIMPVMLKKRTSEAAFPPSAAKNSSWSPYTFQRPNMTSSDEKTATGAAAAATGAVLEERKQVVDEEKLVCEPMLSHKQICQEKQSYVNCDKKTTNSISNGICESAYSGEHESSGAITATLVKPDEQDSPRNLEEAGAADERETSRAEDHEGDDTGKRDRIGEGRTASSLKASRVEEEQHQQQDQKVPQRPQLLSSCLGPLEVIEEEQQEEESQKECEESPTAEYRAHNPAVDHLRQTANAAQTEEQERRPRHKRRKVMKDAEKPQQQMEDGDATAVGSLEKKIETKEEQSVERSYSGRALTTEESAGYVGLSKKEEGTSEGCELSSQADSQKRMKEASNAATEPGKGAGTAAAAGGGLLTDSAMAEEKARLAASAGHACLLSRRKLQEEKVPQKEFATQLLHYREEDPLRICYIARVQCADEASFEYMLSNRFSRMRQQSLQPYPSICYRMLFARGKRLDAEMLRRTHTLMLAATATPSVVAATRAIACAWGEQPDAMLQLASGSKYERPCTPAAHGTAWWLKRKGDGWSKHPTYLHPSANPAITATQAPLLVLPPLRLLPFGNAAAAAAAELFGSPTAATELFGSPAAAANAVLEFFKNAAADKAGAVAAGQRGMGRLLALPGYSAQSRFSRRFCPYERSFFPHGTAAAELARRQQLREAQQLAAPHLQRGRVIASAAGRTQGGFASVGGIEERSKQRQYLQSTTANLLGGDPFFFADTVPPPPPGVSGGGHMPLLVSGSAPAGTALGNLRLQQRLRSIPLPVDAFKNTRGTNLAASRRVAGRWLSTAEKNRLRSFSAGTAATNIPGGPDVRGRYPPLLFSELDVAEQSLLAGSTQNMLQLQANLSSSWGAGNSSSRAKRRSGSALSSNDTVGDSALTLPRQQQQQHQQQRDYMLTSLRHPPLPPPPLQASFGGMHTQIGEDRGSASAAGLQGTIQSNQRPSSDSILGRGGNLPCISRSHGRSNRSDNPSVFMNTYEEEIMLATTATARPFRESAPLAEFWGNGAPGHRSGVSNTRGSMPSLFGGQHPPAGLPLEDNDLRMSRNQLAAVASRRNNCAALMQQCNNKSLNMQPPPPPLPPSSTEFSDRTRSTWGNEGDKSHLLVNAVPGAVNHMQYRQSYPLPPAGGSGWQDIRSRSVPNQQQLLRGFERSGVRQAQTLRPDEESRVASAAELANDGVEQQKQSFGTLGTATTRMSWASRQQQNNNRAMQQQQVREAPAAVGRGQLGKRDGESGMLGWGGGNAGSATAAATPAQARGWGMYLDGAATRQQQVPGIGRTPPGMTTSAVTGGNEWGGRANDIAVRTEAAEGQTIQQQQRRQTQQNAGGDTAGWSQQQQQHMRWTAEHGGRASQVDSKTTNRQQTFPLVRAKEDGKGGEEAVLAAAGSTGGNWPASGVRSLTARNSNKNEGEQGILLQQRDQQRVQQRAFLAGTSTDAATGSNPANSFVAAGSERLMRGEGGSFNAADTGDSQNRALSACGGKAVSQYSAANPAASGGSTINRDSGSANPVRLTGSFTGNAATDRRDQACTAAGVASSSNVLLRESTTANSPGYRSPFSVVPPPPSAYRTNDALHQQQSGSASAATGASIDHQHRQVQMTTDWGVAGGYQKHDSEQQQHRLLYGSAGTQRMRKGMNWQATGANGDKRDSGGRSAFPQLIGSNTESADTIAQAVSAAAKRGEQPGKLAALSNGNKTDSFTAFSTGTAAGNLVGGGMLNNGPGGAPFDSGRAATAAPSGVSRFVGGALYANSTNLESAADNVVLTAAANSAATGTVLRSNSTSHQKQQQQRWGTFGGNFEQNAGVTGSRRCEDLMNMHGTDAQSCMQGGTGKSNPQFSAASPGAAPVTNVAAAEDRGTFAGGNRSSRRFPLSHVPSASAAAVPRAPASAISPQKWTIQRSFQAASTARSNSGKQHQLPEGRSGTGQTIPFSGNGSHASVWPAATTGSGVVETSTTATSSTAAVPAAANGITALQQRQQAHVESQALLRQWNALSQANPQAASAQGPVLGNDAACSSRIPQQQLARQRGQVSAQQQATGHQQLSTEQQANPMIPLAQQLALMQHQQQQQQGVGGAVVLSPSAGMRAASAPINPLSTASSLLNLLGGLQQAAGLMGTTNAQQMQQQLLMMCLQQQQDQLRQSQGGSPPSAASTTAPNTSVSGVDVQQLALYTQFYSLLLSGMSEQQATAAIQAQQLLQQQQQELMKRQLLQQSIQQQQLLQLRLAGLSAPSNAPLGSLSDSKNLQGPSK